MNLQEHIRKVLNEETKLQSKLKDILNDQGIKNASIFVGGMDRLIKILNLNEKDLDKFIYKYLTEEYYPDYNWGPELHDFYREDVDEYGAYDFYINDVVGYTYLGEYDGYDYLYTLVIHKWVADGLKPLFGNKWIPVFKEWFEHNSGLTVREIDLENKYIGI